MKITISSLFLLIIINSCYFSNDYSYQIKESEVLEIDLDSITSNYSFQFSHLILNNKEFLSIYNRNQHAILIWDLETKQKKYVVKLNHGGPNGIYRLSDYYISNIDSIYAVPSYYNEINLLNSQGEIISKFDLKRGLPNSQDFDKLDFTGMPWKPMMIIDSKLILGTMPYLSVIDAKFGFNKIGFSYDIKTGVSNANLYEYSDPYKEQSFGYFHSYPFTNMGIDGKSFIVSFPADENIYQLDTNGKILNKYLAKSDFFTMKIEPAKEEGQEVLEKYYLNNPAFANILSDPYRKVYYRFALQKYDGKEVVPTAFVASFKPLSVIILNEQFEKIGETLLPADKHFILNAFVGKRGLYISNAHPNNPENDENKLSFSCYQLVKK
jgi:hypothetical protein